MPTITEVIDDIKMKIFELRRSSPLPFALDDDEIAALLAYSHDVHGVEQRGRLYFELNAMLRRRDPSTRHLIASNWGVYMHYVMSAMQKLPDFAGTCWRGMQGRDQVLSEYVVGRPIQWGAFTSTTTNVVAAKNFASRNDGVLFKITVTSGKDINGFSFFPSEDEILLSPNHRFIVSSAPYDLDGYTVIDMVQSSGHTFVS